MPRDKPTNKLDVIGNLDLKPEDALGDYIESKLQEKYFIKPPDWDSPGDSLELLAIQNEREYVETQKIQAEIFDMSKKEKALNSRRIKEMYNIEFNLRERIVEVSNFIRDCEEKKQFAIKKIKEEEKIQNQLMSDIRQYSEDFKELSNFLEVLNEAVKEMEPYETVIKEVVEKSDIIKSVKDCMDRCDALMLTQVEITELEQEKLKSIEEIRSKLVTATNEAALTILGLNNELAHLERAYNDARDECFKWEKVVSQTKDYILKTELNKERVLDAIQQSFKLLCRRRGLHLPKARNDIEGQVDFIKEEIEILQHVIKACQNASEKE